MARPTKGEIRQWLRQVNDNLIAVKQALVKDDAAAVEKHMIEAAESFDEAALLSEERYNICIFDQEETDEEE